MTTADALLTFSAVQAELAAAACMLLDLVDDQGDAIMTTTAVTVTASNPRPSRYTDGAMDVDIALSGAVDLPDGEVTLYPDPGNGGYGTLSTPRDIWASDKLLIALDRALSERDVRIALSEVEAVASVSIKKEGKHVGEIEVG